MKRLLAIIALCILVVTIIPANANSRVYGNISIAGNGFALSLGNTPRSQYFGFQGGYMGGYMAPMPMYQTPQMRPQPIQILRCGNSYNLQYDQFGTPHIYPNCWIEQIWR